MPPKIDIAALHRAAESGNLDAQLCLGSAYFQGLDVPRDDAQAAAWYRKAAEQGSAEAQYNLGLIYENGAGLPQDNRQAASWHRKAAEQGYRGSQECLGELYADGRGVSLDESQAVAWYRKAAEQGSAHAQFQLGARYEVGRSVVPQDLVYAHFYYSLAASRATRITKALNERARDRVTAKMTQQQIAEAQKLAREWVAAFEQRQKKQ